MTYQCVAKRAIQITITLMVVLFTWVSYHQFMSAMSMESMPSQSMAPISCITFCFITSQVDIHVLVQSFYYSFEHTISAWLIVLAIGVLQYTLLYHVPFEQLISNVWLNRQQRYYRQQRWRFKLFSLWSKLYQQGIVAPQVYS